MKKMISKRKNIYDLIARHCLLLLGILLVYPTGCKKTKIYKIGLLTTISGDYANDGLLEVQAAQLAIREFGEQYGKIGGRDIQLVIKDLQAPPAEITRDLIQTEKIIALLGPAFSSVALAVADEFQRAKIPMIAIATNPKLTEKGDYIFRIMGSDALVARVQAHYLQKELQLPSLAILHTAEDAFSETLAQNVASIYKELGGEVLQNIGIPKGTKDFTLTIEELAPLAPAVIYAPVYLAEFSSILAQLREDPHYQNTVLIAADPILKPHFFDLVGNTAEQTIIAADAPIYSEKTLYFRALYKILFDMEPSIYSIYTYDSTMILLNAMRKTHARQGQIDQNLLRQEIQHTAHIGVSGRIEFAQNGDAKRNITIFKIKERNFEKQGLYTFKFGGLQRIE